MLLFEFTELTEAIQDFYLYKIVFSAPGYGLFFIKDRRKIPLIFFLLIISFKNFL